MEPSRSRKGQALQLGDAGAEVEKLQSMLSLYGYGVEKSGIFDRATEIVVAAFQRHFRPRKIDGIADAATVETLRRLVSSLPCDSR